MNQEEADQDVVDEVSEEVDSRGKVMHSMHYFNKFHGLWYTLLTWTSVH